MLRKIQAAWLRAVVLWACAAMVSAMGVSGAQARGAGVDQGAVVAWVDLPQQGRATYRLILQGGPFPYEKDGTVFGNRERLLPAQKRGYYREYTVPTPGSRDRGARRIVCGGKVRVEPAVCFYTDDHYASFRQIVVNK
jgi:ribonuclease T1